MIMWIAVSSPLLDCIAYADESHVIKRRNLNELLAFGPANRPRLHHSVFISFHFLAAEQMKIAQKSRCNLNGILEQKRRKTDR